MNYFKGETIEPEIKVTRIGKRWHSRLILSGKVIDEMACSNSLDIGWICREMLRWHSKLGYISNRAEFARDAKRESRVRKANPVGQVWYRNRLPIKKGIKV
jgi:hypothetical protein